MSRIVVVGGTGTIGAEVVRLLAAQGHEAVAASPSTGVDIVTGRGLARTLAGAEVVVDTSKPGSFAPADLEAFFTGGILNLLTAERTSGVRHHLSLSIVGADRAREVPFYRAKAAMEEQVRAHDIPFTIVHATQFFEFAPAIAAACEAGGAGHGASADGTTPDDGTAPADGTPPIGGTAPADGNGTDAGRGQELRVPATRVQPIAGDAVARHLAALALEAAGAAGATGSTRAGGRTLPTGAGGRTLATGAALGGDLEIAGPEELDLADFSS